MWSISTDETTELPGPTITLGRETLGPERDARSRGLVVPLRARKALAFSGPLRQSSPAARHRLHQQMLLHIARQTNHHPFGRIEPRLLKRETARFAYLREPRWKARLKCLS